jgi:hypothetical protein
MSSINLNTSYVYSSGLQQKSQNVLNLFFALRDGDLKKVVWKKKIALIDEICRGMKMLYFQ